MVEVGDKHMGKNKNSNQNQNKKANTNPPLPQAPIINRVNEIFELNKGSNRFPNNTGNNQ